MDSDEIASLQLEFEWLLNEEVNVILNQLCQLMQECHERLQKDKISKETFVLSNSNQQDFIKITADLHGEDITSAEIKILLPRHSNQPTRFLIPLECGWKLDQVQDASNHLAAAISLIISPPLRYDNNKKKFDFKSAEEVIKMINGVMSCLHKGRNSLIVPKKKTFEELRNSRNMKFIQPPVPNDLAITFYIQSHKLFCAVYQELRDGTLETYQTETSVPWFSEVLVLFTVALQFCQQLKDKVSVFTQYTDMQIISNNI